MTCPRELAGCYVRKVMISPAGSSGHGFGTVLSSVFYSGPCDNPPREDHDKRAEERGNEILEGYLQLSEPEVDSEQPEQLATDHCAGHADHEIRPAAQALP